MKYLIWLLFLSPLLLLTPISPVSAHILKSDGTIGAVLHINPEDDPIVGEPAGFFFEFKDKTNKFNPQNCSCNLTIIEDGKTIYSQALFKDNTDPSLTNASLFYTFPEKNVYQIKVTGTPTPTDSFQAFELTYDLRVSRESTSQPQQPTNQPDNNWIDTHYLHLIVGGFAFLILVVVLIKRSAGPKS